MKTLVEKIPIFASISLGGVLLSGAFLPAYSQLSIGTLRNSSTIICLSQPIGGSSCGTNEFQFSGFTTISTQSGWLASIVTVTEDGVLQIAVNQNTLAGSYDISYVVTAPTTPIPEVFSGVEITYSSPTAGFGNIYSSSYNDGALVLSVSDATVPVSAPGTPPSVVSLSVTSTFTEQDKDIPVLLTNTYNSVPVPWETDVLPIVGATFLFAGGVWWKQKRTRKTLNLTSGDEAANKAES